MMRLLILLLLVFGLFPLAVSATEGIAGADKAPAFKVADLPAFRTLVLSLQFKPQGDAVLAKVKNFSTTRTIVCETWSGSEFFPMGTLAPGESGEHLYQSEPGQPPLAYDQIYIRCSKPVSDVTNKVSTFDLLERNYQEGYAMRLDSWKKVKLTHPNPLFGQGDITTLRCLVGPRDSVNDRWPQVDIPTDGSYSAGLLLTDPLGWYTSLIKDCSIQETKTLDMGQRGQMRVKNGRLQMALQVPQDYLDELAEKNPDYAKNISTFVYDVLPVEGSEQGAETDPVRFVIDPKKGASDWQSLVWQDDYKYGLRPYQIAATEVPGQNLRFQMVEGQLFLSFGQPDEFADYNLINCRYGYPDPENPDSWDEIGSVEIPHGGYSAWLADTRAGQSFPVLAECAAY